MRRGRPKSEVETCVLAVRIPVALRDELDRYLAALETRLGLKARLTPAEIDELARHIAEFSLAGIRAISTLNSQLSSLKSQV